MRPVINYFKESWQELTKINWPTRQQTIKFTIAVTVFSLIFGLYIGAVDTGLTEAVKRFIIK